MIEVSDLPVLSYEVAVCGCQPVEEVAGPGCYAAGVLLGVLINQAIG